MWIDQLVSSRTTRAVELTAAFAEQRHRVLAENLANVDTPDYHAKELDPRGFQATLKDALDVARTSDSAALELRGDAQVSTDRNGRLVTQAATEPPQNVLFHDGTNARLERTLGDVGENQLLYELSINFLRTRYQNMLAAIRGRTS